ncbi:mechanosensitive ion channel [Synechococcus sp. Cruz-9H2]|uniref:mechanosensitive ion channel family protein n=1 Tax=unclassified Synechococcus TaxID=2626047 RepID=UPI0020CD6DEF|nr:MULTISPECIES: mechanosensitive ion channel domain-containing protein [unclassified Synechococcus]MCP9819217.1 mechanosensitive ion channel [Synechococcus sp. Cruz-9H2]MCP9843721.1 mechanosensitive ion channel [Synechococcus sp. Edmonson 11F2]MCP9855560.1 mechanosensitive ion channel [Synechococcus sp. Cruz-9C9]MCP9862998.1 mechanosensitive ion channel [Synechococcus sp. Cruz-7E5]MCP9870127.1 mechanosensitive ion channel [Synechococcus sp. Cruz-7B9]
MLNPLQLSLPIPLLGILLAAGAWLSLQLVGKRLPSESLGRALVLRSRLSLTLTLLVSFIAWWLLTLLGPELLPMGMGSIDVRNELIFIGLIWTLLRWKGEIWRKADTYSQQVFPNLPQRERLYLFDLSDKLLTVLVMVIISLELLRLLGTPTALLATAGGFGAAALGFGARTIVENGLSGISLYINRPFVVGDFIRIPAEDVNGTVQTISWFYTELRDPERQPIFIPNSIFTVKPIINVARIDSRRVWIDFGLRYDDRAAIEPIIAELREQLDSNTSIDHDKAAAVHFVGYGESSLNLRLLCYVAGGDIQAAWDLQQELLLRVGEVVEKHQAGMPFPTRSLIRG